MGFASSSSLLLLLLSLASFCVSNDQLSPVRPLVFPDDKLVSNNGFFALGIFSPTNSITRFYVSIWYNMDPQRTVVWVANRDNPITTSSASSSTTLAVTNRSELVLSDRQGRIYWSTTPDTGGVGVAGASVTLLNEGNLVLLSSNGTILWQSFDHPTDTILSGMTIRMNYRAHFTTRLVSWKSSEDPSTGDVSLTGDASSGIQFFVWHGSNISWRSPPLDRLTGVKSYQPRDSNWIVITSIVVNGDEISMTYSVPDGSPAMHMHGRISYSGRYEFRIWNSSTSLWTVALIRPGPGCDGYAFCGPFSYCDNTVAVPTCKCPDGFEPNGWTMSGGCMRKEPLRCEKDRFVILKDMKTPAMPVFVRNKSFDGCAEECLGNCSCTAYTYTNLTNAISEGDQSRCLLWFGELLDVGKFGELDERQTTSDDLYLRLPGPGSTAQKTNNLAKILLPIIFCVLLIALVALVWTCRYRGTQQKEKARKRMILEYLKTATETGDNNIEFPFISFEDIVVATDNFSDSNMLGKGGFGKVYKGILEGTMEVAVKRLSKGSGQGTEEFRNEVVLISKLQHKNLVKLLGCCIHEDEKMLVYEYLPNKSLDYFIFDSARKPMLQWPMRFKIIQGIARGIMYLHHDSRLTIIHRDLKASNILLDKEMSPKISDFGMARIFYSDNLEANTNRVVGTYGYMSHEYAMEGAFSVKSDTYSFGVLLLEIVSGLKISSPQLIMDFPNLIVYAWNLWKDGKIEDLVDSPMKDSYPLDEVSRCVHIGLLCVQDSPDYRPLMSAVVFMLENKSTPLPAPEQPMYFARRDAKHGQSNDNRVFSLNGMSLTALEGR